MADQDHVKVYDPNAQAPEVAPEVVTPPRTPSQVLGEFFRAVVHHLGSPPKLESLIDEFEELTKAPDVPAPSLVTTEDNHD